MEVKLLLNSRQDAREWSVKMMSHRLKCRLLLFKNTDNTAITTVTFPRFKQKHLGIVYKDLEGNLETVP
jgi:hypothetical protein